MKDVYVYNIWFWLQEGGGCQIAILNWLQNDYNWLQNQLTIYDLLI